MATGTTEFIDVSTADVFLEEVWAKEATVAREEKLVFVPNTDRRFEAQLRKGQIIRIQEISNLSARSKTANTAVTYETVQETEATITVDEYFYAAFAVEDIIEIQSSQDLRSRYSPKLGYALAEQEDAAVAALIDDGTITQTVGTLAAELSYDNLVRADQYLNDANVPEGDRVIIISPAQKAGFLKLDQFIHRDYADIRQGLLGSWMGQYPIFVTTNVDGSNSAGHDSVMMHKEAIAHVSQIEPTVKSDYDIDFLATKVVAAELYDHTIIRADHAVWMKSA